MTKIEVNFGELNNFTIGLYVAEGEDENGVFSMLVIGIGLIELSVFRYA